MPGSSSPQPRRSPSRAPKPQSQTQNQTQPQRDPSSAQKGPPKRRLYNIVQVRFPDSFKAIECDLGNLYVEDGIRVVVQTRRGPVLGTTSGPRYRKVLPSGSLQTIQRVASEADLKRDTDHKVLAVQALKQAIEHARLLDLDMKFITTEIMLDGSVLVCYFSAEGRVDFRNLVRDLSRSLGMRIEMHQVGVRNGAGSIGGIGSCGRELCCSTFLNDFEPVAIRMVKDQGLTLNPKKVSGMCGRLMCCLVYEHSAYVRGRKTLPRPGQAVRTALGPGTVREVDIHRQTLSILHESGEEARFPIVEVVLSAEASAQAPRVVTIDGPLSADTQDPARRPKQPPRRPNPPSTPPPKTHEDTDTRHRNKRRNTRGQSRDDSETPPPNPRDPHADSKDPKPPRNPAQNPRERAHHERRPPRDPRQSKDSKDSKDPKSP